MSRINFKICSGLILCFIYCALNSFAVTKISTGSGNWNVAATWNPIGVPTINDDVVVQASHKVLLNVDGSARSVSVNVAGELTLQPAKKLSLNGVLTVNGKIDMNGGDIQQQLQNALFTISNTGSFIWNPNDNLVTGASLFLKSVENFSPNSTLTIRKWYSYTTVPLGSVVTGNFGNVFISTLVGGTLFEWNQDNQFETHKILGTLSIDQGWVVLDKAGHISNTTIGSINMVNMNSVLDFHSGTHPTSFIVNTDSIVNIGGEINGILNGNGNITLNVTGNFTNLGNVELIYNAGVAGVGNGNATINVGGKYKQTNGDLRGVFNLSTTTAGSATMTLGSLELTGGLMMGFYGCSTSGLLNKITVNGDMTVSLTNANDKFRVNGLTSLAGQFCNSKSELNVTGNLNLSGIAAAEFTSSGSVGSETVHVTGNVNINGLGNNFNFGSHATNLRVDGDFKVMGGYTYLSRFPGATQVTFNKDVIISAGTLAVKGSTGSANVDLNGNYVQSGGAFIFHNNANTVTPDVVSINMNGVFNQLNGIINYDDNASCLSTHVINVKGTMFTVDGSSSITRAGAGNAATFGKINFSRQGIVQYKRNSSTASIDQVKQSIANLCTVDVMTGNFQLASHANAGVDYLTVGNGSVLQMHSAQIISNGKFSNTGFNIAANGRLMTQNVNGFYNSSGNGTVKNSSGLNYSLDPLSIVEYNGSLSQTITGIGEGIAIGEQHKYGVLSINYSGSNPQDFVQLISSKVFVRSKLILQNGELRLNSHTLNIESGNASSIQKVNGFIKSESSTSVVKWKNVSSGSYVVPFGESVNEYLPVTFTPTQGKGDVTFFSYKTNPANEPLPIGASAIKVDDVDISTPSVMDRWFGVEAEEMKADITFSFSPGDNTTSAKDGDEIKLVTPQNEIWKSITSSAQLKTNLINTIKAIDVNSFGVFAVVVKKDFKETYFNLTGELQEGVAQMNWIVSDDNAGDMFTVERSEDGVSYSPINTFNSNSTGEYAYTDTRPVKNISYYRIKKASPQSSRYSDVLMLGPVASSTENVVIESVYPNPFNRSFAVNYSTKESGIVKISLVNSAGQSVYSQQQGCNAGGNVFDYTESRDLPSGTYFLQLTVNASTVTHKLVKR